MEINVNSNRTIVFIFVEFWVAPINRTHAVKIHTRVHGVRAWIVLSGGFELTAALPCRDLLKHNRPHERRRMHRLRCWDILFDTLHCAHSV